MLRVLMLAESDQRRDRLEAALQAHGGDAVTLNVAKDQAEARALMGRKAFDVALVDLPDDPVSALALLEAFRWRTRPVAVLGIDGTPDEERADQFSREGASVVMADDALETPDLLRALNEVARNSDSYGRILDTMLADRLTGLPGRPIFDDRLDRAMAEASRRNELLAIHRIDLDGFADINRTIGIAGGDDVLIKIAQRIDSESRETDTVARLSGDSFAVIQTNLRTADYAKVLARKLLRAVSAQIQVGAHLVEASASAGIAMFPADAVDVEDLLGAAGKALQASKDKDGNTFTFFDSLNP